MKKLLAAAALFVLSGCGSDVYVIKGEPGPPGPPGPQGEPGTGCSVEQVSPSEAVPYGGAVVTCGGSAVLISNGAPGPQGEPGPMSQYGIVRKLDPCGDAQGIYDEVFLLLADGTLLWSLSDNPNGKNTRLAEAADGSWVTTDGSDCRFSVSTYGSTRTITWPGGSYSWELGGE